MIRSFKDLNSQSQTYPDSKLRQKLQKDFPEKTTKTINKALIITNNSYDLSLALLSSECKLDANRFETCTDHQVDSDYVNIILYKNGVLISDKFFCYSESKNRDILKMIQRGEIDNDLIGNENDGYVKLIDRSEDLYRERDVRSKEEVKNSEGIKKEKVKTKGFTLGQLRKQQRKDL